MHLERDHFIDYLLKLFVYQSVQNPVYLGNMCIIIGITGLTERFGADLGTNLNFVSRVGDRRILLHIEQHLDRVEVSHATQVV